MLIEKHIKSLLFENDFVVVPGFGGFICHYVNAEFDTLKGVLLPPSKRVAFNVLLKQNDWLLVNSLIQKEGISNEDAMMQIHVYVENVWKQLKQSKYFHFDEVGVLSLNAERQLVFEPYNKINYLSHSFGLPEIMLKPFPNAKCIPHPSTIKNTSNKFRVRAAIIGAAILTLGLSSTILMYVNKENTSLSTFNPFYTGGNHVLIDENDLPNPSLWSKKKLPESAKVESSNEDLNLKSTVDNIEETKVVKVESKPAEKEVVKIETKVEKTSIIAHNTEPLFYVIVSGFASEKSAIVALKKINKAGAENAIIVPAKDKDNFYRLAITSFNNYESAKENIASLKEKFGESIWILKQ